MNDHAPGSLSRRTFALLAAAGLVTACREEEKTPVAPDSGGSTKPAPAPVAVPTADVHTHLFNASFLPIDGIFGKWVAPTIAGAVARILLARVDDCGQYGAGLSTAGAADALSEVENASEQQLLDRLYAETPADAFGDPAVRGGLQSVAPQSAGKLATAGSDAEAKAVSREEFNEMFRRTAEGAKETFPEKGGFLQWVTLMTWCERKIWAAINAAYPDVRLFVAHMMDMENYYRPTDPPRYDWPDEQLRRMSILTKASDGRLLTFFAFDPEREDWQEMLQKALAHGCAGVKFYPPSGYGPVDPTTKQIRPTTEAFFRECIRLDLPIFTHTTSHGFESRKGYGKTYADPTLWRHVLGRKEFENLRLCFAHAGGEDGWFLDDPPTPATTPAPFSEGVVALCKEYPNVYCEVAYLSPILKKPGQAAFQRGLGRAIKSPGKHPFAKKVMYGSDWHMIHKIRDHRAYLPSFRAALAGSEWDSIRTDFFLGNAARWLNIPRYLERMTKEYPGVLTEAGVAHLRSLITA